MKKFSKKQIAIIATIFVVIIAIVTAVILFKFSFTGVAASVEGNNIMESEITERVEKTRKSLNLEDDNTWYSYLQQNSLDTKTIRDGILDDLITKKATDILADDLNVEVSNEESANKFNSIKSQYSQTDWQNALTQNAMTEEDVKSNCEYAVKSEKVTQALQNKGEYPQELYDEFFKSYGTKINGSTGYYQLCYPDGQEAQAQEMLNRLQSGAISFEDATKEVTSKDSSGLNFDYIIYDCFIQNAQELTDAIQNTPIGQMSGIIKTTGYSYIIKVVDKANCPSVVNSFDQLDEPTKTNINNYANVLAKISYGQNAIEYEMKNMKIHRYEMPIKTSYSKSIFG